MKRLTGCLLVAWAAVQMAAGQATTNLNPLQTLIDSAATGSVISVPSGTYQGSLTLKDGVTLVGDGAEVTTIDGNGADTVIRGANDAMVIGLTIRNGRVAVEGRDISMGVFECRIGDFRGAAIQIVGGSAALANNLIEGDQKGTGILCMMSNPFIMNNVVVSNAIGVQAVQHAFPCLLRNVFVANGTAVLVAGESSASLYGNVFDRNTENIRGQELGVSNAVQPVILDGKVPIRGGTVAAYRAMLNFAMNEKLAEHPVVIYDLRHEPGSFGMSVLFPWATFSIAASAKDTQVVRYEAFDSATTKNLNAQLVPQSPLPTVAVINPEIRDVNAQRYVLDCVYTHPGSYFADENGTRVFKRLTNVTQVEIVVPAGFEAASVNFPATIEPVPGGGQVVKITRVGAKQLEVIMAPVAK
jgi:hypothetical protein